MSEVKIELGYGDIAIGVDTDRFYFEQLKTPQKIGSEVTVEHGDTLVSITCSNEESFLTLCRQFDRWRCNFLLQRAKDNKTHKAAV